MRICCLPFILLLFTGVSCDPYDPDLGERPFRCGPEEPRCPEGYTPVDVSETSCLCEKDASASIGEAGGPQAPGLRLQAPDQGPEARGPRSEAGVPEAGATEPPSENYDN